MRIYLAGLQGDRFSFIDPNDKPFVLETFYYAEKNNVADALYLYDDLIMDSGAFSFMNGAKKVEWASYVDRYADFVKDNKIEKFFELDLDAVLDFPQVMMLRKRLEKRAGKQCIPVWHKSRGKEQYLSDIEDYPYIALGGIVTKEIQESQYKYFPWFIDKAHEKDAKIHALGFTNLKTLSKYHFDSVDSTTWLAGGRFGAVFHFNGRQMTRKDPRKGKRLADPSAVNKRNFHEWCKFQKYAEYHL